MKSILFYAVCMLTEAYAMGQNPMEKVIQLTTTVTESPPAISFRWNQVPGHFDILIYRKRINSISWGNAIAKLPGGTVEYTDNKVKAGIRYEYAIKAKWHMPIETYVTAGIKCPVTEYRGKLILLVDSTLADELKNELARYESDLIGDGWEVLRKNIARNSPVKYVKSVILNYYNSDPVNINTVFLFGHIPVPYSGTKAYDGHVIEHDGAWPADMYYGDLNEKIWTDKYVYSTTAARTENRNIPGDEKFDVSVLPENEIISLSIGRVDFHDLPAFKQSETELLRNYLNKNHAFRNKIIDPQMQALVDDNFGILNFNGISEIFAISGWRNFAALLNFSNIKEGDFFSDTKNDSYIWSYGCGGGKFDYCTGIGSTTDFVNQSPRTVFTALYGSRFGDWDSQNNLMRAALASNGWILTCCWAGRPHYTFHQMGMGETIGECVRNTQNNPNNIYYYAGLTNRGTHTSLLGDPTLRMHIVHPPDDLKSAILPNKTVLLSWKPATGNVKGYYVYKLDKRRNKYSRISDSLVITNYFMDTFPDNGTNYYMVRTLELSEVPGGSYNNLSQGIFDTIFYKPRFHAQYSAVTRLFELAENNAIKTVNRLNTEPVGKLTGAYNSGITDSAGEIVIYPNPSTGVFIISFGSHPVKQASLKIFNLHGKTLLAKTFQSTNIASFDISTFPKGIYIVKCLLDDNKTVTKICLQ